MGRRKSKERGGGKEGGKVWKKESGSVGERRKEVAVSRTPHPLFNLIQNDFLPPELFSKIIYEHYLFDIPKLLDLCVLYGHSNQPLLSKMVANIFKRQPQYEDDWEVMVRLMIETLTKMTVKILKEDQGTQGAIRLDRSTK